MREEKPTIQQTPDDDTLEDVMAVRPLHRIMVYLNHPSNWSTFRMTFSIVLLATLAAALCWLILDDEKLALFTVGWLLIFFFADFLVLTALPRLRISYGPWQSQLLLLAILRVLAITGTAFVTSFVGGQWGLMAVATIQLFITAALIWGVIIEPSRLETSKLVIHTDRLSPDVKPVRLLHISDLHIERRSRREDAILRIIEVEQPELIVVTGDYVNLSYNRDPEAYRQIHDFLAQLSAPYGVFATLGTPTVDIRKYVVPLFEDLPTNLMRGECRTIELGDGRRITLLGLDCTHHIAPDAAILKRIALEAPANTVQVLLYHSPELMPQAIEEEIDLYLCGHTHGGQVRLPLIGPLLTSSQLGRQYVMGLYRRGRTHLYVSRGVGLEGLSAPRARLLTRPEITILTIKPV